MINRGNLSLCQSDSYKVRNVDKMFAIYIALLLLLSKLPIKKNLHISKIFFPKHNAKYYITYAKYISKILKNNYSSYKYILTR